MLLGPEGAAGATSPTSNNDDTNRAASFTTPDTPENTDTTDPAAIAFVNSVQNNGATPANISIIPTTPADLGLADLPTGTFVTITATGVNGSRLYYWDGSIFRYDTDQNVGTINTVVDPINLAAEVLTIPNVAANGGTSAYNVSIDLPLGTRLSTDLVSFEPGDPEYGYPVPVTAFVDTNSNGVIDTGEAFNTSIDRVYVGVLRLLKESRLVPGFGLAFPGGQELFSSITPRTPAPGNRVEYQITYTNISSVPATGSGSLGLNANNILITENGTVLPNNWGRDNDASGTPGFGQIDTLNVAATAIESGGAIPSYFNGTVGTARVIPPMLRLIR
ncbi:hypothetical protein [Chlorogloea sp. CCALA 695]|uniref:hypothetical protein n=1 Tax=Chlorogloea sp. CCALA 695 TaxID=2107693 RepID=UPI000D07FA67|nr:hypothetical protein [Chlorogloea sp. CCALA 695]PSB31749.1 hypothetical protein C7B70_11875 [Chlorogloea sp. CCALA 695]